MGIFGGNSETTRNNNVLVKDNAVKNVYHYNWKYESGKGWVSVPHRTHLSIAWDNLTIEVQNWIIAHHNVEVK